MLYMSIVTTAYETWGSKRKWNTEMPTELTLMTTYQNQIDTISVSEALTASNRREDFKESPLPLLAPGNEALTGSAACHRRNTLL